MRCDTRRKERAMLELTNEQTVAQAAAMFFDLHADDESKATPGLREAWIAAVVAGKLENMAQGEHDG